MLSIEDFGFFFLLLVYVRILELYSMPATTYRKRSPTSTKHYKYGHEKDDYIPVILFP
jgi:hypothetical protein